ncbi:MAG: Gfo/Idh/MocA family oxidoreductase [Pseudonocardia sp.]|uniref:Gfo/Idh/MocA family oxidoreductase n=1 Tax=Pseudonocardia sp. TaxID=60912 RepID=UPI001AD1DA06|nr:Gfo/Idh/MocA family oxidoreductase [Pseudonocardia sp.]MBN9102179.1 Gfo/Idh/MocA family oxidoreductase [Pseudonocardia sp.]
MPSSPIRIGLIGAGRIGASHAALLAQHVPSARLVAVADPRPGVAAALAEPLGARGETSPEAVLGAADVDAVVIAASTTAHSPLVVAAAGAGKHVFCEKPAGLTLAEIEAGRTATAAAGVAFQIGFNRRFAADFRAAHDAVVVGRIGEVRMMRSLTRDPGAGLADAGAIPPGTIFTQTLIHDFDTLNWFNPGARAVDVLATADALVAPEFRDAGLLDTAVVVIRYENGAIATAEANFAAAYGYDVRAEVFGSGGMVAAGEDGGAARHERLAGRLVGDTELMRDAYVGEFAEFVAAVGEGRAPAVTGEDAMAAYAIAEACLESHRTGTRVAVRQVTGVAA